MVKNAAMMGMLAVMALTVGIVLSTPDVVSAAQPGAHQPVFTENGVAIRGTDPVAYFTEALPVEGKPEFQTDYQGVVWHFANAENRDAFIADPEKYSPAYGGYCAYALSLGTYKVATDPDAWSIIEGRLYLNKTPVVKTIWETDIPGNIEKSESNWTSLLSN
ncbi:MAG: YHS domain protein [Rhodobiaceae bacterium]|nr:MAG: YHS domain protein [Rhodobiaceae bacterium]